MAFLYEHPGQMPIDRISNLPDDLLINILNFLPTKYAFITSILSRRWSYLFKEATHLDLDDSLLFNSLSAFNHEKNCVLFRDFVFKMLDCLKLSNLISFRFKCSAECAQLLCKSIHIWLDAILSHGIQEIDLCFGNYVALTDSIFTCQTLCILKLKINSDAIPDTVCLPCLKILHLNLFWVSDAQHISRFFSGCPLLQEVYMELPSWHKGDQLFISVPSLRKLKLDRGIYYGCTIAFVSVVAPLLQCFHYTDKLALHYSIKTSNYLVEAYLDTFEDIEDFVDLSAVSNSARDLLHGVSSVKRLFLSAHCIEMLTLVKELPVLRNLTKLKIGCSKNPHLTLPRLLRSAPNLEELIFSEGLFRTGFKDEDTVQQNYWGRGQIIPSCLETHLKVIEIEHFLGLKEELRIVEYFLSNGLVLEQLIIQKWMGRKAKFKVRKQLKRLANRWKKCVKFNELLVLVPFKKMRGLILK